MGGSDWRSYAPEPPVLFSGFVGGPLICITLTPFRNALGLATQDKSASLRELVGRVCSGGIRTAFRGGAAPMPAAAIQFTAVGPVYHAATAVMDTTSATLFAAGVETAIMYGPESRNIQLSFNQQAAADRRVALRHYLKPWGPGIMFQWGRNSIANSGIRVLSDPVTGVARKVTAAVKLNPGEGACRIVGDFGSSLIVGCLSLPFNQSFYFCATSKEIEQANSVLARKDLVINFLRQQWITESGGVSKILLRDLTIRSCYIACMFTLFAGVERTLMGVYKDFT